MAVPIIGAARLTGVMLGLIIYGIYACIFVFSMVRLHSNQTKQTIVPAMIVTLFITVTVSMPLQMYDIYNAYILYEDGPEVFYTLFPTGTRISAGADLLLLMSYNLADAFLIWRLFVVWGRNYYVIAMPTIMQVIGLVFGSIVIADEFKYVEFRFTSSLYVSIAFTLMLNISVTGLICGRLWYIGQKSLTSSRISSVAGFKPSTKIYQKIIFCMIESGFMYTIMVVFWTVTNVLNAVYAANVVAYFLAPVVGIVPTVITLRLNTALRGTDTNPSTHRSGTRSATVRRPAEIPLGGISITRHTEVLGGENGHTMGKTFEMSERFPTDGDDNSDTEPTKKSRSLTDGAV